MRLVKGAYWDTEIKLAQVQGHADYPVFTRKAATDASWLANARRMLAAGDAIDPAFATHNAHSLAFVLENAAGAKFEMQRLHGMGEALYDGVVGPACPVRVYAPVGTHSNTLSLLCLTQPTRLARSGHSLRRLPDFVQANCHRPCCQTAAIPPVSG